jgi:hypothetical protein
MSRHGYNNCIACHVAPSGGGVLNLYGREISKEALSTWARPNEQKAFYNLTPTREDLYLAGFARGLQLHRQNQSITEGRPILMQADLEGAFILKKIITFDVTAGKQELRTSSTESTNRLYFRRYYLSTNLFDYHHLRVGKFEHTFGLNDPNHYSSVRRHFSFGQDSETFNYEYSYLGESFSFHYTEFRGNPHDEKSYIKEKGRTATVSYFFMNKNKIGFSALQGHDQNINRGIYGLWGIYSLSKTFYLDAEVDLQRKKSRARTSKQNGYTGAAKLHYAPLKGFAPYALFEKSYLDSNSPLSETTIFGGGIDFFPRPHFELNLNYQRETLSYLKNSSTHLAWLMLNFYL